MLFLVFLEVQSLGPCFSSYRLIMLHLPSSTISLFADDIALYRSIQSPSDYTVLQADITAISMRIRSDQHLLLHADKCCYVLVSLKRTNSITTPALYLRENSPLKQVDSIKYLGVMLTPDLTWSEHISNVCSKVRKVNRLFHRPL